MDKFKNKQMAERLEQLRAYNTFKGALIAVP